MNAKKCLDIPLIFKSEADDIKRARENAIRIHGTDIRAAGNEVESIVRDYFKRMLPPKYYVTHGHLIDMAGNVSSQLDLIIADNFNLPSLLTTKDGTEYVPLDSVYAIGEIKSTYYKSSKYVEQFSNVLEDIHSRLYREEITNTAYGGDIKDHTLIRDMVLGKGNRVLNWLFTFMLCVDGGDFEWDDISMVYIDRSNKYLPNLTVLLNKGIIMWGSLKEDGIIINRYPDNKLRDDEDWFYVPYLGDGSGSLEGNHLGILYWSLLEHLSNSYLEPPSFRNYINSMMVSRKSLLRKAKAT